MAILGIENKRIVLFGAGYCGRKWLEVLSKLDIDVEAFIDNDKEKHGQYISGVPVFSLDEILENDTTYTFVISVENSADIIRNQLVNAGIKESNIIMLDDLYNSKHLCRLIESKIIDIENYMKGSIPVYVQADISFSVFYDDQAFAMQKYGGISRCFFELAEGLERYGNIGVYIYKGVNISGFKFGSGIHDLFSYSADEEPLFDYRIRQKINRDILRQYFSSNPKFDIYHPTYYGDYGLANYKKKIITVHDMIHELFGLDKKTIEEKKKMVESADGIIAVSENTKRDLIDILNVPEEKIKVIHHGNSLNYNVSSERLIKEPYLLYVGERGGYKNCDTLLRAFAECTHNNDIKLICFGGGKFRASELELIKNLGILRSVEQIGGDDTVLANLYAYAELFIYPSKYEGFGIPLLEAMHYGTPIITGDTSSMPEVAGDAAEYFNPDSYEDLRDCIDCLLDDKLLRNQYVEKGYKQKKLFSWDKTVMETYDYYKSFL